MAETIHSKNYEKIKQFYLNGLNGISPSWNIEMLYVCVNKTMGVTEEEYNEITGFIYPNKQ